MQMQTATQQHNEGVLEFALVRLGRDSVKDIKTLDGMHEPPAEGFRLQVTCTQVSARVDAGAYCFVWLGSDNNKGQPTEWKQGLRALGNVVKKEGGPNWNDTWTVTLDIGVVFRGSIDRKDLLAHASAAYYWCSDIPIIGLSSNSNQTFQSIAGGRENQNIGALLYAIASADPDIRNHIPVIYPEIEPYLEYIPATPSAADVREDKEIYQVPGIELPKSLDDEDPEWGRIRSFLQKGRRLFLFVGAPGTGKSYYASQVAATVTDEDPARCKFVQFHPSVSYDDFVEGYVPTGRLGGRESEPLFSLRDKTFLRLAEQARNDKNRLYAMVIDEFTRGDVSRILGELMTYLEEEYREVFFTLAYSGREISIPRNLVVIATMNPYDRSVAELDSAMERRFIKVPFDPDMGKLEAVQRAREVEPELAGRIRTFFHAAQELVPNGGLGHTCFFDCITESDVIDLWNYDLRYFFGKLFRFDTASYDEIFKKFQEIVPGATDLRQ